MSCGVEFRLSQDNRSLTVEARWHWESAEPRPSESGYLIFQEIRRSESRCFACCAPPFLTRTGTSWNSLPMAAALSPERPFTVPIQGEFDGIAPTGRQVAIRVIDIVRIAGNQLKEHWNVIDVNGRFEQLS